MNHLHRFIFFTLIVRPVILLGLGLNVRHRERLPASGPAIIVANHNSHLDTVVLMTLFPRRMLRKLRPVAAADYFLKNRLISWFSQRIIGIVPIKRKVEGYHNHPLEPVSHRLDAGDIMIIYPEGSRGDPKHNEEIQRLKTGIAYIAKRHPDVPIYPIFLHGLSKALPKGEALFVPFFCDVFVGEPLTWNTGGQDRDEFMHQLESAMHALSEEGNFSTSE
jgi:1-acyl-sn-glycerol-3-phosphate acyltransferase